MESVEAFLQSHIVSVSGFPTLIVRCDTFAERILTKEIGDNLLSIISGKKLDSSQKEMIVRNLITVSLVRLEQFGILSLNLFGNTCPHHPKAIGLMTNHLESRVSQKITFYFSDHS